jgi:two-component system response regulator (stage 0 sporulation protein A)
MKEAVEENDMREVYRLIRKLGATSKYKGYYFVAEAVRISMESPEKPMKITKDIYPYLAKKYKSTTMNVEHDIRTVVNVCWITNKESLDEIAGYSLRYRPTNSEFVDMLAYYLVTESQK